MSFVSSAIRRWLEILPVALSVIFAAILIMLLLKGIFMLLDKKGDEDK
jgi:hypothetical protein